MTEVPEHDTGLRIDPDALSSLASDLLPSMLMLPMLASSLLGGGAGGGHAVTAPNPNAVAALQALKALEGAYGKNPQPATPTPPASRPIASSTKGVVAGNGSAAQALATTQLYQHTAATAFNNLDNQLAAYLTRLAGGHGLDRTALTTLIHNLDTALSKVGSGAYTAAGQQQVHDILAATLKQGQSLVSGTQLTDSEIADAINQLTLQYLYNLNGKSYQGRALSTGSVTTPAAQKAISTVVSELGKPYVWGGEGPDAFDCQGLMHYAALSAGVNIPSGATAQYQQLPKVSPSNIRPGDLIFPDSEFDGGSPQHVMMYIGNEQCVEAPHTGAVVRVTGLPSSFHASRWS
ncbi:NlpC/P60 family protein [Nocardia sp. NBC_00511]|uniref:C40 family peptidase n=1 Tax=Nocardia sp. NBC_00511 TaxID=2903591 RepID=UPI002F9075B8